MSETIQIRDGSNAQPGLLASAFAIAGWACMQAIGQQFDGILGRVLSDVFSRAILAIAIWSCVYGLLQIWACRSDKVAQINRFSRWILARDKDITLPQDQAYDTWHAFVRRRSAPLTYAVWVLPTLGFLGTVLGISAAIGEMSGVFADGTDRGAALGMVLSNLEFAFDTTFAGLMGAVPVMGLLIGLRLAADSSERVVFSKNTDAPSSAA